MPLNVAIVGSGPGGLYAAEALVKQAALLPTPVDVRVDVLDRLPAPYGLVRYGVAPDHKSIKSVANYLRRVLESPGVTFIGGVHFGTDVTREDLLESYDAVVYATGAMRDRRLGIAGEDLPGSHAATDFVNWYCGHPDIEPAAFSLDAESVAVIGVGNVAVDVARILIRDPAELAQTDIPEVVMDALRGSKIREVHVIGRRGPAQAKFTTKELRELGELDGVRLSVDAAELDLARRRAGRPGRPGAHAAVPLLAPPDGGPPVALGVGVGAAPGAHPAVRERRVRGDRPVRDAGRAAGAAQRRLPVRAAARRPVRLPDLHGAERPRTGPVRGRPAASR
jgi:ferredoxin/flavodoxin---NADP+ reductase